MRAFRSVFGFDSTQDQLFGEVSSIAQSTIDGYNCCIFAYGQTGSGKTFSMEGTADNPGVNILLLRELFRLREAFWDGSTVVFRLCLIEIYNERVQDLLAVEAAATASMERDSGSASVLVSSFEEAQAIMKAGCDRRATGSTDMNSASSRSHLVMSVCVESFNAITGTRTSSKLNLVDLAGSERLSRTGAEGVSREVPKSCTAFNSIYTELLLSHYSCLCLPRRA